MPKNPLIRSQINALEATEQLQRIINNMKPSQLKKEQKQRVQKLKGCLIQTAAREHQRLEKTENLEGGQHETMH